MGSKVYGQASPNSSNVVFPFGLAMPAARDLVALADAIDAISKKVHADVASASRDWTGPQQTTFVAKAASFDQSAASICTALNALAGEIAEAWAAARGQQDRINNARHAQHESNNRGFFGGVHDFFAGDEEFPPPANPPVPSPKAFRVTSHPVHPEFGP